MNRRWKVFAVISALLLVLILAGWFVPVYSISFDACSNSVVPEPAPIIVRHSFVSGASKRTVSDAAKSDASARAGDLCTNSQKIKYNLYVL
jgi:hypothetical protein